MIVKDGVLLKVEKEDIENKTFTKWDGIIEIGDDAFKYMHSLVSIDIPSSVKKIGRNAFYTCSHLKKVNIGEGVRFIGEYAFYSCVSLKKLKLSDSIKEIEKNAFSLCSSLETFKIPSKIKVLNEAMFEYCHKLKRIIFNDNLKEIKSKVFFNCSELEKIAIPDTVKKIGKTVFYKCSKLKNITLPNTLALIEDETFSSCYLLKSINIPKSLKKIGKSAFSHCYELENVVLNDCIDVIDNHAFNNCKKIKKIYLPDSISKIGTFAFLGCKKLKEINLPKNIDIINESLLRNCVSLKSIKIPENVTKIEDAAFYGCSTLSNIYFNDKVTSIGNNCFANCFSLKEIFLPKSLNNIEMNVFYDCKSLKKITFSSSIKEIQQFSFSGCKNLEEVILPENLEKIGVCAFCDCKSLKSINMPKSLRKIYNNAFKNCKSLKNISFENYDFDIDDASFFNCKKMNELTIGEDGYILNDFEELLFYDVNNKNYIISMIKTLGACFKYPKNIKFPGEFLKSLSKEELISVMDYKNLVHFRKIYAEYVNEEYYFSNNFNDFYKFAYSLGCFDNENISINDKSVNIAQKSSVFLNSLLQKKILNIAKAHDYFDNLVTRKYDVDFLKFIMQTEKKGEYNNFHYLYKKGKLISFVMNNIEEIKQQIVVDSKGRIVHDASFKRKIECFLSNMVFVNVEDGNLDLVEEFSNFKIIGQNEFEEAQKIRKESDNTEHNILKTPLKEKEIIKSINKIQEQIDKSMIDCKKLIDELYNKEFTYEWLDKHDPKNFTLGLYCDCCASIVSVFYGKLIMIDSIKRNDVQNLVIKNDIGKIVAKATIYVNKEKGYAVFNDIEMNRSYGNEIDEDDRSNNSQRIKIYNAFKRGVKDFIEKYNEENSDKPLTQVNIGWGYNRLKQIIRKRHDKSRVLLGVIDSFEDAKEQQWVIYKK